MKFVNDSGHFAGNDPGACDNGETEAILAKAIRDAVNAYCDGLKIPYSCPPFYYDTVSRLNADSDGTHKISIHINSCGPNSTGLLALKNIPGTQFAEDLMTYMSAYTKLPFREVKNYWENLVDGIPRYTREFDEAMIPLVLIEAGFISNAAEVKTIKNAYLMAKGIIHTYIQMHYDCQMITWFKIGKASYIDNLVEIPLISAPVIKNSRTLLGLGDIAKIFKATVQWIPTTKSIIIEGLKRAELQIGSITASVNDVSLSLNSAPVIINSRSFIGLSDLTTIFGGVVFFIPVTKEIVLLRY
jgi:hypothetical protein